MEIKKGFVLSLAFTVLYVLGKCDIAILSSLTLLSFSPYVNPNSPSLNAKMSEATERCMYVCVLSVNIYNLF